MKILAKIGPMIAYLLVMGAVDVAAQITTLSEVQSNAEIWAETVRSNSEYRMCHPALTNAAAQSNFFRVHGVTETEYASNVLNAMRHAPPPKPWPEPSKRQETFEHCAAVLRSVIDTNQIQIACKKLTNQPAAALALKSLANEVVTNLDMFAGLLFSPDLESYFGYRAKLSTPTNIFYFDFWWANTNTPVRDIEKRTPDAKYVLVSVRFYENGKLFVFDGRDLDNKGILRDKMQLVFNEDGTLRSHWMRPPEPKP
jgi:hypothetical protein